MTSRRSSKGLATSEFEYRLPEDRIARFPSPIRDQSRLLVLARDSGNITHLTFRDLPDLMAPGDVLVVNDSRVRAARFHGHKATGAAAEVLLLRPVEPPEAPDGKGDKDQQWWEALVKPGSKLGPGRVVVIGEDLHVRIVSATPEGSRIVVLESPGNVDEARARHGKVPLPPYLDREAEDSDRERYQTVYANVEGSAAAPTAGLHFTPELLSRIEAAGVQIARVRLDVGVGTFRPVEVDDPADHPMHREGYEISAEAVATLSAARATGGEVWAVGTTTVRALEAASIRTGAVEAGSGWTELFIRPGFRFKTVDHLITNFHLPKSTLLMLVSAFAGHDHTMAAYAQAIEGGYRFYSYGDAMVCV